MKKKVIIIGAGPAGVTAGYELLKKSQDYEVTILEANNAIGGISKTVQYKGNRMDIGGHRFFSKDKDVNDFWEEIMPLQGKPSFDDKKLKREKTLSKNGPDPEKTDNVMLVRHRVSRIYYLKKFFDYPVSMKFTTFKNMGLIRTIESGFSYLKTLVYKRKETNLENFYINRFGKKLYSMFFEKYTEKLWGRHPSNISADWGAQRVKGLSITAVFKDTFTRLFHLKSKKKETSLIEEYKYPKYGPGELWEEVAHRFEKLGGTILKNHEVIKIKNINNKIESVTCLVNGQSKEIKGDIFISSMPIKDLINGMNKVPTNIKKISNGLPYRDFVTVGLLVKKLNLKNETKIKTLNNIVPDCWIYVQEADVKLGRIQIFNNWSPYMVEKPEETVWLGLEYFCNENDEFWNMEDNKRVKFAIKELIKMEIIDKDDVLDYHVEKVKKAYPAYFDTYKDIDKVKEYINKYDNLYCVGRNGQHRYNNMDHSMVTSFKTVDCILDNSKNKEEIWNVNTETEYHEEEQKESFFKKTKNKIKNYFQKKPLTFIELSLLFLLPFLYICYRWFAIDNDAWIFLNHGRYILNHGIPHIEPFTLHVNLKFTMQQWLYSVIFYTIYKYLGSIGIIVTFVLTVIILIYVLYKLCYYVSQNKILSAIITSLSLCLLISETLIVTRPQIITYILLILFVTYIEKYYKTGKIKYLFPLPIISLLEINLHASMWWFLFVFTLPFIVETIVDKIIFKKKNIYSIQWLIIFLCICFTMGFLNPYGADAISYIFQSSNPLAKEIIGEMRVVNALSKNGLFIIGILFINIIFLLKEYKRNNYIRTSHLLLIFGTFIIAFNSEKGVGYYYIFALYPIASYFSKNKDNIKFINKQSIWRTLIFIIILGSIIGGIGYYGKDRIYYKGIRELAKEPLDYLEENYDLSTIKLFIDYDYGAEAEYRGIKCYIDQRAEVFYKQMNGQEDIFEEYYYLIKNMMSDENIDQVFKDKDITHILIENTNFLFIHESFTNYTLIKETDYYKLYVRNDQLKEEIF